MFAGGIDPNLFHPRAPTETLKRQLGLDGTLVCSCIGTIGMARGLDVVLRTGEILRNKRRDDIAFLLVADGAIREELEKRAKERRLHNIVFTGRQDKGLMPDYCSISDACLVHLEKRELFQTVMPSKVFEAQAMARPIILGVEGFASDMVRHSKSGICIEPENDRQLVEAVQHLADHPAGNPGNTIRE